MKYKTKYDIMLANVINDVYFLFPRPVHIAPSSLSSATINVANFFISALLPITT